MTDDEFLMQEAIENALELIARNDDPEGVLWKFTCFVEDTVLDYVLGMLQGLIGDVSRPAQERFLLQGVYNRIVDDRCNKVHTHG